jgi:hypothetical protein
MGRKLVVITLAALALAAPAGAVSRVALGLDDEFAVKNTHILCTVQISKTFLPGQKILACFYATTKGPVPKSYAVALSVNGEVALGKVEKNGTPRVVMTRKPASGKGSAGVVRHPAKPKLYAVGLNAAVFVKGTAMTCGVSRQKIAGKQVVVVGCFKVDKSKKPRADSYGIGITDGGAFLVHFDSKSKGTPIKIVEHGK